MGSVRLQGLSKAYRQYPHRWARLAEWLDPRARAHHHAHWVLRDIDLEIKSGEALGVVGINGAGKSTLLKIITGTTKPTLGSISVSGRIASLLELGIGFHPEFTGRQNVFMAGQLLGLAQQEIADLLPAIIAFAEIGDYIDQPVRVYSSGMQMRLAFSVATARRPDVLIVDEALSVGDAYFQHKSFNRIREFRTQGTSLLIASHDRQAIQSICDHAILLSAGRIIKSGAPEEVMDFYNAMLAERESQTIRQERLSDGSVQTISGTGEAEACAIALLDADERPVESVEVGAPLTLQIKVKVHAAIPRLVLGYMIKDRLGQPIYGTNTHRLNLPLHDLQAGEEIVYRFKFNADLGKGSYSLALSLSRVDSHLDKNYQWRDRCLLFHVVNTQRLDFVGCAWLDTAVEIDRPSVKNNE